MARTDPNDPTQIHRERGEGPDSFDPHDHPQRIGRYRIRSALGRGAFGLVYLAEDEELARTVAIKVPQPEIVLRPEDVDLYLSEARIVASLDHPHIAPVFDVGSTEEFPCYIVSKFVEGLDLAAQIARARPTYSKSAELVALVADALHHAHKMGLVHRDVKPANILLDQNGKPYVVDFGLALREEDFGKGPNWAGTAAYMSPEQARGEGHRVDGRSDVFSLGIVLYELLTGRRPFKGDTDSKVLALVTTHEPRPPVQYDENLPKELQRICFKALSKRATDRYSSAHEMSQDLKDFLADYVSTVESAPSGQVDPSAPDSTTLVAGSTAAGSESPLASQSIRVIPKGLRSFDEHDSEFFLRLLPGPRDRHGLPGSIRFWQTKIEPADHQASFPVGLIYGPSGCGKSSFVKAGLLPRLSEEVVSIYTEAASDETAERLLAAVRSRFPATVGDLDLQATLAALRQGSGVPTGKKVLIVLDQFEQWLHSNRADSENDLVQALRQCDGHRLQCIVLVRDDFWLALSRFMQALEVNLSDGQNIGLIDLLDHAHARKLLIAFGKSYGRLPESTAEFTKEQHRFLDEAVNELSQDGEVVPVKLSLFVEMLKERPWTPKTLREFGGVEGLGVAFLRSTFDVTRGNPEYRTYRGAVRSVLAALVAEPGVDIKGKLKSPAEIAAACGLDLESRRFRRLIEILDGELHLISPADVGDGEEPAHHYQLAHDYLVPAVNQWLTQHLQKTWRGRSLLRLKQRAAEWQQGREHRFLPSLGEYLTFSVGVPRGTMNTEQRRMLSAAGRYYGIRSLVLLGLLILIVFPGGMYARSVALRRSKVVEDLRLQLLNAEPDEVLGIVDKMRPYRRDLEPVLSLMMERQQLTPDQRVFVSVALLPSSRDQRSYLSERMVTVDPELIASPEMLRLICSALRPYERNVIHSLRERAADTEVAVASRLRAAGGLILFEEEGGFPSEAVPQIADWLVAEAAEDYPNWVNLFDPLNALLVERWSELAESKLSLGGPQPPMEALAKTQAGVAVLLSLSGQDDFVWSSLRHQFDPRVKTHITLNTAPPALEVSKILDKLDHPGTDSSICFSLTLVAGDLRHRDLTAQQSARLLDTIEKLYVRHPDPGVHSAAEWALQSWGRRELLDKLQRRLIDEGIVRGRDWYVTAEGHTMAILSQSFESAYVPPAGFIEPHDRVKAVLSVPRRIAFATKEVTVGHLNRFQPARKQPTPYTATADGCAAQAITIDEARLYCNWLSEMEGIPTRELCYRTEGESVYEVEGILTKEGYRLPSTNEWRYACGAGTVTKHFFGTSFENLASYAWYHGNSNLRAAEVGVLRPNAFGAFDVLGNVAEWCHSEAAESSGRRWLFIGSSYDDVADRVRGRTAGPGATQSEWVHVVGLRIARTMPPP